METVNVLEILEEWGAPEIQALVSALNTGGVISDEDKAGLSSTMVEKWTKKCESYLRSRGYLGGEIEHCGKYFNTRGAIYALYDSSALSHEDAFQYLVSVSKRPLP